MGHYLKTIIVGGVAGGMSAATRLRRLDESAEIVIFERGEYVSFANCGLPYFIGGLIENRSSLLLQTPESLAARFRLDVRVQHEVVSIDRAAKTVTVRHTQTGVEVDEAYDTLILATGATARANETPLDIPTHTLRTIDDIDYISAVLAAAEAQESAAPVSAIVLGGGFIGLEAVENLVHRGLAVTLVQRAGQVMTGLDAEMAAPLIDQMRQQGVDVRLGVTVSGSTPGGVSLSDGSTITADIVIDARGVFPETFLARLAGLAIGTSGGVWVDESQRTSDPFIYAVGDGVEKTDAVDSSGTLVTMAGLANRHGRAAADSIAGTPQRARPALGTAIIGLFGLTAASVGWNERRVIASGRAHRVIHTHPASHAGYYPGAEGMAMKLIIDADTDAILGAQIVGGDGVDKRIDVIAVAMTAGLSASALMTLELAYAPQYSSAKDPVNQLGYVADNLASGLTTNVQWHELEAALAAGEVLVDVRTAGEFGAGSIPGAVNIPLDDLRSRLSELPDAPMIVHCQVGQRGHTAARILRQAGLEVRNLDGGFKTFSAGAASVSAATETNKIAALL
jgi:NADPH-dependent 2,4-dienoyl-CoA reductase/sulfur reductase-like enzyme/rhodanese-related sulfurtransferase